METFGMGQRLGNERGFPRGPLEGVSWPWPGGWSMWHPGSARGARCHPVGRPGYAVSTPAPPPVDRQVVLIPSAGTACHNPRPVASCHSLGRSPAVLVFLSALLPMSVAPRAGTSQPALDSRARGGCQGSARPRAHPSPSPHPRTGMAWRWADRCLRSPSLCDHIRPRGILVNCGLQGLILFQSPLY